MVNGGKLLLGQRLADDDFRPLEPAQIEHVQRLAALHHHVVADIHHVVDHRHPDAVQATGQPSRTRTDLHAPNHAGRVTRAEVGTSDRHLRDLPHLRTTGRRLRIGDPQRLRPQHGDLPRYAEMAQAVGTVTGHLQVNGQVLADALGRFVVQAGHGQAMGQFGGVHVQGNVILEPVPGNDHRAARFAVA